VAASKEGGSVEWRGIDRGGRCVQACGEACVPWIGLAEDATLGVKVGWRAAKGCRVMCIPVGAGA